MQTLVEDFLQYLRHERGQAEHTQRTYAALLNKFTSWAAEQKLADWNQVTLAHLMSFLQHERERVLAKGRYGTDTDGYQHQEHYRRHDQVRTHRLRARIHASLDVDQLYRA